MSDTQTHQSTRDFQGVEIPEPGTFEIDPSHSTLQFVARHMMVSKVRGTFGSYAGTITIAEEPLASSVEVTIDSASVDTRDEARDTHLRSGDFFDVESFPQITYRSRSVESLGGARFKVEGDLVIRGESRPVSFEAELEGVGQDPWGNQRIGFSGELELDREDFGLTWNQALETGGVLVGKKIRLDLDIEATRTN